MSFNEVSLHGVVHKHPLIGYTAQKHTKRAKFTVVTYHRSWPERSWDTPEEGTVRKVYHRVWAFGRMADFVDRWVRHGTPVLLQGQLRKIVPKTKAAKRRLASE